jgi:hypothetical protein
MIGQDPSGHCLADLLVILQLALVLGQKGGGDLTQRGSAAILNQNAQHERLVDVGHFHLAGQECVPALERPRVAHSIT